MDKFNLFQNEHQVTEKYFEFLKYEFLEMKEKIRHNENLMEILEKNQKKILEQNEEILREIKTIDHGDKEKYVSCIWNLEGASDKLVSVLEEWMFAEKTISDKARLIYLCCLLERDEEELAAVGLRKYYAEKGSKYICNFLPLTWLANKINIGSEIMKKAAYIFERLQEEQQNRHFAQFLKEHSFAIVGNSPDIIGSKAGEIIDSRDVVFRMNTYIINDEYKQDTGKKVNALVDNSNFATLSHENHMSADGLEWLYLPYDFWHIQLSQFTNAGIFIESYYNLLRNSDVKITWLFPEDSIELKRKLRMISPTSGMAIFYSIYKNFGFVNRDWFFGFSQKKRENGNWNNPLKDSGDKEHEALQKANIDSYSTDDQLSSFYKDTPCYSKGHNLNRELELREELYAKDL